MRKISFNLREISIEKMMEIINSTILFSDTEYIVSEDNLSVFTSDDLFISILLRIKTSLSVA